VNLIACRKVTAEAKAAMKAMCSEVTIYG